MKVRLNYQGSPLGEECLDQGIYNIGRRGDDMITIVGPGFGENGRIFGQPNPTVSKKHLTIEVEADEVILYDNNTTNGSYLDNKRIDQEVVRTVGIYRLRLGFLELELVLTE